MFQHVDINPRAASDETATLYSPHAAYVSQNIASIYREQARDHALDGKSSAMAGSTNLLNVGNRMNSGTIGNDSRMMGVAGMNSDAISASIKELDEVQRKVVRTMSCRLQVGFVLLLIPQLILLFSIYWYTTVIGMIILAFVFIYCWTHRERKSDFILMYSGLLILNAIKDIVLIFFFFFAPLTDLTAVEYVAMVSLIVDAGVFIPYSIYYCVWLHRSLSVTVSSF